jgi:hypothetical protein
LLRALDVQKRKLGTTGMELKLTAQLDWFLYNRLTLTNVSIDMEEATHGTVASIKMT